MNIRFTRAAVLSAVLVVSLSACGAKTLYEWNGYDYALLKHYKDGTGSDELATSLKKIIDKTEEKEGKVPPGLYADYAYALYEAGNVDQALLYFNKERNSWPESEPFMSTVIERINSSTD